VPTGRSSSSCGSIEEKLDTSHVRWTSFEVKSTPGQRGEAATNCSWGGAPHRVSPQCAIHIGAQRGRDVVPRLALEDGNLAVVAVARVACNDATGPHLGGPTISIVPVDDSVFDGDSVHLAAHVFDGSGAEVANAPLTWTVSDTTLARVAGERLLALLSPGTVRVITGRTVTFTSDDSPVAIVAGPGSSGSTTTGLVLAVGAGSTTIRASVDGVTGNGARRRRGFGYDLRAHAVSRLAAPRARGGGPVLINGVKGLFSVPGRAPRVRAAAGRGPAPPLRVPAPAHAGTRARASSAL
jgi:hypothetical protein